MGRQRTALLCLLCAPHLRPAEPVRAELAAVRAQKLERSITLPGELVPYESVTLFARVQGFVEKVLVDKGSQVKLGQPLVILSAPEIALQTAAAESKFRTAKSRRAEAEARREGARLTYAQVKEASRTEGAVSEAEVLQALSALQAASAAVDAAAGSVDAAESALRVTRQMEEYLTVAAPFDGVVTARHVHPGALVGPEPNAALLRLEHTRRLRLDVGVPEADSAGIAQGAGVAFTVPAYPARRFPARVARISRSVDPKSRTMSVELDVDNSAGLLAPGMYAELSWPVRTGGEVLAVPSTAIVRTSDRMFVVRVRQGEAEWVEVRRGASLGGMVEVTGDLTPGDLVLRRGTDEVRPGSPVQGLGKK